MILAHDIGKKICQMDVRCRRRLLVHGSVNSYSTRRLCLRQLITCRVRRPVALYRDFRRRPHVLFARHGRVRDCDWRRGLIETRAMIETASRVRRW